MEQNTNDKHTDRIADQHRPEHTTIHNQHPLLHSPDTPTRGFARKISIHSIEVVIQSLEFVIHSIEVVSKTLDVVSKKLGEIGTAIKPFK